MRPLLPRLRWVMLVLALAMLALMLIALASCSPVRLYESARLLGEIADPPAPTDAGPALNRSDVVYEGPDGPTPAYLYLPPGAAGLKDAPAAVLLVPGLAPAGRDDTRLVPFAAALANARFAVMVPDIAGFRAQRIGPDDTAQIAAALAAFGEQVAAAGDRPVGIAAISYAVGPAVLATLTPEARGTADFLVAVGGYHDLTAVLTYFTTGAYRMAPDAPWQQGSPNAYGKWVFVRANLDRIADLRDRTTLDAMATRRLGDLAAPIDDLAARLGPEGRTVYDLLANTDPDRVPELAAALPVGLRADMAALDLKGRDLSGVPPRVLLIHGRDDPIIPASESVALAAALPPGRAKLVLIDSLVHAELGPADWPDLLRMWQAAYTLLEWRDGL